MSTIRANQWETLDGRGRGVISTTDLDTLRDIPLNYIEDGQQASVNNVGMFTFIKEEGWLPQGVNVQSGDVFPENPSDNQLFILGIDKLYYYSVSRGEWILLVSSDFLASFVVQAEAAALQAKSARDAAFVNADVYDDTAAGLAGTSDGEQFQVVAGDEIVRYRNESGSAVEVARYPAAESVRSLGLFNDAQSDIRQELLNALSSADRACAFDFTNRRTFALDADTQTRVERVLPIVGDIELTGGAEPPTLMTNENGLTAIGQPVGVSGRQRLFSETPLIQNYPCTLVLSQQTNVSGSARTLFWQRGSGGDGEVQITSNRQVISGSTSTFTSRASVYIQGSEFPDGTNSCNFNWTIGRGNTLALVLRAPTESSELWVNGLLVSTFVAPPQILQENSYLMGSPTGVVSDPDGVIVGRCIAVDAALSGDDLRRAGEWVAQGLGQSWLNPVVTDSQVQTPATCAAIYHLPKSSVDDGNATDLSNARLLYAKNPTLRLRPASTIKTLTALVAERNIDNLDQLFTVTSDDLAGGSGNNLLEGDQITARDALYNLMIASSNTSANLIARSVGQLILDNEGGGGDPYDRFITEMNTVAETIGMGATLISNPSGLNVGTTRSNADDLAKLLITAISAPLTNDLLKTRSHSFAVIGDNARIVDVSLNVDLPLYDDMVHRKGGNLIGSWGKVNTYMASFMAPNGDLIVGTMLWEDSPSEISSAGDTLYALVKAVEKEVRWPSLNRPENQRLINPVSIDEGVGNLVRGHNSHLFDFTNPRAYVTNGEVGSGYRIKHLASLTSSRALRYSGEPSVANTDGGTLVAQLQEGAAGFVSETPLVTQLPCTLAFSLKANSSNAIYAFFQSASGEPGRIQIMLNGRYNGSILATTPDKLQVFVEGAADGGGIDGQPVAADVSRGRAVCGIVVFRDGVGQSEIWVNGGLVDTFTMPPEPYQGQSILVRNIMPEGVDASYARLLTIDRDVNADEIAVLGEWLADGYGEQWSGRPLTNKDLLGVTRSGYGDIISLAGNTYADVLDFTNPLYLSGTPVEGQPFPTALPVLGDARVSGPSGSGVVGVYHEGQLVPGQPADTDGRLFYGANKPLVPETADCTIFLSCFMEAEQTGSRTILWQHSSEADGRAQWMLNSYFTGSLQSSKNDSVNIWTEGTSGGQGIGGTPKPTTAIRGVPARVVIVLRQGEMQSELWVNGKLGDRFTRPPIVHQTNSALMGPGGSANQNGRSYGRIGVIHRALDEHEVALAGKWVGEAYGVGWEDEVLTDADLLPNALSAACYLISTPSAPEPRNSYKNLRPLYLSSHRQILYPASMTKVLSCIVLLDNEKDMDKLLTMQEGDQTGGSGNNLSPGDSITVSDAIYNMMLPSSNVTATVVARHIGQKLLDDDGLVGDPIARFVEEMNLTAQRLGMYHSNFTNPSGLSNVNMVTTAEDMAHLCANVPSYPDLVSRWGKVTHEMEILGGNARTVTITHSASSYFSSRSDAQGGKTGTLGSSTRNFMWIASAPGGNYTANVVMLTNGGNRYVDANIMQDYVLNSLRWPVINL